MPASPFVSIGLPVFNAERYLPAVIEAHLAQTHENFELIISDNASSDATAAICADYAHRDRRIVCVREDANKGLSWNHARVLELSRGSYFRWGAGDDLLTPGLVAEAVQLLESDPLAVLCVPHTMNIDEHGQVIGALPRTLDLLMDSPVERAKAVLVRPYQMVFPQGLMRRDTLLATRRRWTYFGWDFVLLLELALRGRLRQTRDNHILRRLHPNQASVVQRNAQDGVGRIEPTFGASWVFPHWRWQRERFRAVAMSPLTLPQKLAMYQFLCKHSWWARDLLMHDIGFNLRHVARRPTEMPF